MRIGGMTLFGRLDRYVGGLFLAAYATAFLLIVGLTTIVFLATNLDHFEPWPDGSSANHMTRVGTTARRSEKWRSRGIPATVCHVDRPWLDQ